MASCRTGTTGRTVRPKERIEALGPEPATSSAASAASREAEFLLTIPGVQAVTAATFLGAVGDVRAYESSRQTLRLAGLSLVEKSSGTHMGKERISKRSHPVLRRHAYIFALRCVRKGSLFREEFEACSSPARRLPKLSELPSQSSVGVSDNGVSRGA